MGNFDLYKGKSAHCDGGDFLLIHSTMQDALSQFDPDSIDCFITDPPYELGFMGKSWDSSGVAFKKETWELVFKALKPGGFLLAFGGSRTQHRISCAIEDAGFEIRDIIMWLYGSGFPKSQNAGKQYEAYAKLGKTNSRSLKTMEQENGTNPKAINQKNNGMMGETIQVIRKEYNPQNPFSGCGTCLKPAYEPIIVARKPFKGSLAKNLIENGVGALNIDGCRIPSEVTKTKITQRNSKGGNAVFSSQSCGFDSSKDKIASAIPKGRFPANVILDGSPIVDSLFPEGGQNGSIEKEYDEKNVVYGKMQRPNKFEAYEDDGSASRYFAHIGYSEDDADFPIGIYCPKAGNDDREEGLAKGFDKKRSSALNGRKEGSAGNSWKGREQGNAYLSISTERRNLHPTVKPVQLMRYLIRLVAPKGAIVCDPFMGSGSTGKAVMMENLSFSKDYRFIGIEMTEEYLPIAKARIEFAKTGKTAEDERKEEKTGMEQMSLFETENK